MPVIALTSFRRRTPRPGAHGASTGGKRVANVEAWSGSRVRWSRSARYDPLLPAKTGQASDLAQGGPRTFRVREVGVFPPCAARGRPEGREGDPSADTRSLRPVAAAAQDFESCALRRRLARRLRRFLTRAGVPTISWRRSSTKKRAVRETAPRRPTPGGRRLPITMCCVNQPRRCS